MSTNSLLLPLIFLVIIFLISISSTNKTPNRRKIVRAHTKTFIFFQEITDGNETCNLIGSKGGGGGGLGQEFPISAHGKLR